MTKYNPANERIKRRYFVYLKEAEGYSEQSIDAVAASLNRFETYTKFKDFKAFHYQVAVAFKNHLAQQRNLRTSEMLSKSTLNTTLASLRKFFHWLADQSGYKSRIHYTDSSYFNLTIKDARVANARREKKYPSMEQILHTLDSMPLDTDIDLRNRALIAFTILTGARDKAIASMKLKHVDLTGRFVTQDAREVKTKFSKTFTTYFFPVGEGVEQILIDWVRYLQEKMLWGYEDPLFPSTRVELGENGQFTATGLAREHWSDAAPIRKIFKEAFNNAGLPYFNPHSFRDTLVKLGEMRCQTPEEFKAWSQNLGHEQVLTTFMSYGTVPSHRQAEIIKRLNCSATSQVEEVDALVEEVVRKLKLKIAS